MFEKLMESLKKIGAALESFEQGKVVTFDDLKTRAVEANVTLREATAMLEKTGLEVTKEAGDAGKKPDPKKEAGQMGPVDKLKALIDKGAEETEEAYAARCADAIGKLDDKDAKKEKKESVKPTDELTELRLFKATIEAKSNAAKLMEEFKIPAGAREAMQEHLVQNCESEPKMRAYLEASKKLMESSGSVFFAPNQGGPANGGEDKISSVLRESKMPLRKN